MFGGPYTAVWPASYGRASDRHVAREDSHCLEPLGRVFRNHGAGVFVGSGRTVNEKAKKDKNTPTAEVFVFINIRQENLERKTGFL